MLIICGTLPTLRKFFLHFTPRLLHSSRRGGGSGGGPAAPNPMGSFDMASFLAGSKKEGAGGAPAVEGGGPSGNGGKKNRK